MTVSKNESGLKRLFGGAVKPVTATATGEADGPATRQRVAVDLVNLPPGSYSLELAVTDNRGRRRERVMGFRIIGEEP